MTRIKDCFEALQRQGRTALIPFIMAGDPDLNTTRKMVCAMANAGGDIIELGIPYSDPLADGPVNQRAAARALARGIKIKDIFEMVRRIRKETNVPILFLVYFNCLLRYGLDAFLAECEADGVDGLVIPDLPLEERRHYRRTFAKYAVDLIPLAAPTSGERVREIVREAAGFVYCVTSTGVTGTRQTFETDFSAFMEEVGRHTAVPRALGFGISTREQAQALKAHAEGIIIGSAIVKRMEECDHEEEAIACVSEFLRDIRGVL